MMMGLFQFPLRKSDDGLNLQSDLGAQFGGPVVAPAAWRHDAKLTIGDSTSALNSIYQPNAGNGALYNFQTNGGGAWEQVLLGDYRWGAVHYRGRSGIRAQNIATGTTSPWYIDRILESSDAYNVQVQLGINDMRNTAARTSEQIRDDIFAIVDKCLAQGRRVAVCSVMPPRSDDADITPAFQQKQMRVNLYIQTECAKRGCGYIALSEAVTDWTNLTVYSRSISPAVVTDTLHQNNLGAYIMGKCFAAYWLPLRTKLATYQQHYTNNAKLDDTALQLLPNPLFNTDADWYKNASAYGTAGDAPVYNIITAPDGIGKAWQIDVPNVPSANASNTYLINALWDNAPTKYIAGKSIKIRLKYKLEGLNGAGSPVNVYHPWAYAAANSSGTLGASACLFGMPTNPGYITEGHSGVLEGPPYRFTGLETGTTQDVWIGVRCGAAASFRLTVWAVGVYLDEDQYRDYPYTWTDSDTPIAPPVYG